MAIIYSYPQGTPTLSDNVIGSQIDPITEENKTVQFTVGQIASFANSYSLGYTVYTALLTQAEQQRQLLQYYKILQEKHLHTLEHQAVITQ